MADVEKVTDLADAKRRRAARTEPQCTCGNYRAVCSPMGRPCCYADSRSTPGGQL